MGGVFDKRMSDLSDLGLQTGHRIDPTIRVSGFFGVVVGNTVVWQDQKALVPDALHHTIGNLGGERISDRLRTPPETPSIMPVSTY